MRTLAVNFAHEIQYNIGTRIRGTPFAVTFGSQGEVIAPTVFVQSQENETILDTYLAML